MEYLFILGGILLGGYFVMNGLNHFIHFKMLTGYAQSKGVPMAGAAVLLSGFMLFLGGLGIILGIYIEFSVLLLVLFLLVTTLQMHQYWKITDQMLKMGEQINFYKNISLIGALLMLLAIPLPWVLSLF